MCGESMLSLQRVK